MPCFTDWPQTLSPLATCTLSHRASQDLPTLDDPARMCSPWESSVSTINGSGMKGLAISVAPSMVLSFGWLLDIGLLSSFLDFDVTD